MVRVFVSLLFIAAGSLAQTARVAGVVRAAETGEPVSGAVVRLMPSSLGTTTGDDGRFALADLPAGSFQLVVIHIGYRTVRSQNFTIHPDLDTSLTILMSEEAIHEGAVVVTASRRAQSLEDVPVSMATMNAEAVASRVTLRADDAIRSVSGVTMIEDQINIRGSSGYSRGVGSRVLLLLDGIPLLTGDTGEINWETIPADQIERVEVVKGAGSALYGSSALGGVVNIITKQIERDTHVYVRTLGSLYDRFPYAEWNWSPRLRRTGSLSVTATSRPGEFGYLVSVQHLMDESYRQNDVMHRYGLFGKLTWQPEGRGAYQLTWNAVRRLNGNFFWWKSLRDPAMPPDDQQQRWVESDRGSVSMEYRSPTVDGSGFVLRGQYFGNDWSDRIGTVIGSRSRSDQITLEGQVTQVIGQRAIVIAGGATHGDRVKSNIFGTHPGFGFAAFVQSEYRATDELSASFGFRLDWQKVSVLAGAAQLDPRLAFTYRPAPLSTFRASVGTGFRYPSIGELYTAVTTGFGSVNVVPNPALLPERSLSLEIGAHQLVGEDAWVDGALFRSEYRQLIEAGVDPELFVIRFNNVARARIQGVEVTAGASWWDGVLTTTAGLTAMDPRDLVNGGPLKFRPKYIGVTSAELVVGDLRAGVDYRYISRQDAVDDDLIAIANVVDGAARVPIHVVDARCSLTLDIGGVPVRPGLALKNLMNYQYAELIGNLAPPRSFAFTLDAMF